MGVLVSTRHMVVCFHQKYGQPIGDRPQVPSDARVRFRWALMLEEMREAFEATFDFGPVGARRTLDMAWALLERMAQNRGIKVDLPEFVDGLLDTKYVIEGTLVEFGVDGEPIMRAIHKANMAKLPNPGGKPIKPDGWIPPNIAGWLRRQDPDHKGWKP